ncbi:transposase InsO family protein [Acholeplasma morum]|nr:transposase InsO family protein [Paracholeplasma morum]
MREMGIMAIYRSRWIKTTINSDFSTELENILKRDFKADKPNTVWVTDIMYIWTYEGYVYLASVMDLFSRKIIAWELTDHLNV